MAIVSQTFFDSPSTKDCVPISCAADLLLFFDCEIRNANFAGVVSTKLRLHKNRITGALALKNCEPTQEGIVRRPHRSSCFILLETRAAKTNLNRGAPPRLQL